MENKPESETARNEDRDELEQIQGELELIKSVHLRSIAKAGKAGELDDGLQKQIASYLKVIARLAGIIAMRRRPPDPLNAPSVKTVWEALERIPELAAILSGPGVRARIGAAIDEMLGERE